MNAHTTIQIDAIDQLDQIVDEFRTIWLAMGNTTDMADDYLLNIREAMNGATNRLADVRKAIEGPSGQH